MLEVKRLLNKTICFGQCGKGVKSWTSRMCPLLPVGHIHCLLPCLLLKK